MRKKMILLFFSHADSSFESDLDSNSDNERVEDERVEDPDPDSEEHKDDFSTEVESNVYVPNSSSNDFEEVHYR